MNQIPPQISESVHTNIPMNNAKPREVESAIVRPIKSWTVQVFWGQSSFFLGLVQDFFETSPEFYDTHFIPPRKYVFIADPLFPILKVIASENESSFP
jgi:hypothetical protein